MTSMTFNDTSSDTSSEISSDLYNYTYNDTSNNDYVSLISQQSPQSQVE